ncbi:MAG: TolC family protein [Deltaproteobacteria bacterium]|nr:TolC family protein [Deltaproteobacteria bacterium]
MRWAWTIVLGMTLVTTAERPAWGQEPDAAGATDAPGASMATTDTATPAAAPGREQVDTAGSARRIEELERAPYLPQIFLHQWRYREPPIAMPESRSAEQQVAELTLAEAIHAALEHNPGIAAQRLTPLRQLEDVRIAEATFDPDLILDVNKDRTEAPNSSALSGVRTNVSQNFNANVTVKKLLRTGANFEIDFDNNRLVSNAKFQALVPQYKPQLLFSLNQPLLRNFGANFAYLLVDISNITSEQAQYTYRAQLANFVQSVVLAYWNVVNARETLAVRQKSLALAQQTLHENTERVRVGLLAPVSVTEARSQEAAREADVIVAENALDVAQRTLRQTVYLHRNDTFVPQRIDPVEPLRVDSVVVDADQALAVALERRPEIIAQNLDLRSKNLTARVRENQVLPRLDAIGSFGLNGLSGNQVPVTLNNGTVTTSPFGGTYGKSLDRLTSTDFYSYSAGVELEVPLGNASAKAQYAQARIDVSSSELNRRQLLSDVTLEVQKAVNAVITNMKRLRATHLATELGEQNLRDQQKRLDVGMATTKDILDFQDQLTTARGNEVQAQTDYNVSLGELARAQGTLLDQYSVVVEVPGTRFVPWWAKF